MKTFILAWTAVSIMASAPAANAGECRYETDEIDSFTKEQLFATKALRLMSWFKVVLDKSKGHNSTIRVSAIREGEQTFLALEVRLRKTSAEEPSGEDLRTGLTIPEGAELLILMADRSIVSLHSDKAVTANTRYEYDEGNYLIKSSGTIRYRLDADTIEALSSQDATKVRFAGTSGRLRFVNEKGNVDFEITKKATGYFKDSILCLQQHGKPE